MSTCFGKYLVAVEWQKPGAGVVLVYVYMIHSTVKRRETF